MEMLPPKNFFRGALAAAGREEINLLHLRRQGCKCKLLGFLPEVVLHAKMVEGGTNTSLGGSSSFWRGEGRVPGGNVATLELVVFGVGEPGFLQAGKGEVLLSFHSRGEPSDCRDVGSSGSSVPSPT